MNYKFERIENWWNAHAVHAAMLLCFLLPLKLSIVYFVLFPVILLWIFTSVKTDTFLQAYKTRTLIPIWIFIIIAFITSILGISPLSSIVALVSLFFYTTTAVVISKISSKDISIKLLFALLLGQSVSALHSILDVIFPDTFPRLFLGTVTESGQLAMTVTLSLGLLLYYTLGTVDKIKLHIKEVTALALWICPILCAALLVNLKRGPWLGVFIATIILVSIYAKRFLVPTIIVVLITVLAFEPIQTRISDTYDHFMITGGRGEIWSLGAELTSKFPLGIGFNNSHILNQYSENIPEEMDHFHSNLINILVETGWVGLFIFLWWLLGIFKHGFRKFGDRSSILKVTLCCALFAWQVSGLVEYNFGDTEVYLVAMVILGLMVGLVREEEHNNPV